jgi:uncharacterized protein YecE (DUF72 family)
MKPSAFLDFYAQRFHSVEINASFYKLPLASTLEKWRDATPGDFLFAAKASRYLTHRKKLRDPKKSSTLFFEVIKVLGKKLGPVLVQLPPRWHVNAERLEEFLEAVPKRFNLAFEFRDESWLIPPVYKILERHGAALTAYDFNGRQSPVMATAPFTYVRLHGPNGPYRGQYDDKTLSFWARHLRNWARQGLDAHCYFDNDEAGFAFKDALRLAKMVKA